MSEKKKKRQKWIQNKIRKLVGEGKTNKQAVAIALAMASGMKFNTGGSTEGESEDIDAYKQKVVGILGDTYDQDKVTSIVDRMSSLRDQENDPQLAKLSRLDEGEVKNLASMVDDASKTFKRGEDEGRMSFLASFAPATFFTEAGSRNVAMNNMLDQIKDIQGSTGLTVDEVIDLANDIIMSSNKPEETKQRMADLIGGKLRDSLS
tara:strand:- start:386 stop:1003 length:618 start_codon:yes stop_codon:yes gene_type:complete